MRRLVVAVVLGALALAGWYGLAGGRDVVDRARYPLRYDGIVRTHARNYRLDPALLAAVIAVESRFQPHVRSTAGAIGLMQLLPETAKGIATRTGGERFKISDLDTPELNVRYGAWYLRHLIDRYATHRDALDLALAAYNAGSANVDAWVADAPAGQAVEIPAAFAETRAYVHRVRSYEAVYRRVYARRLGIDRKG